MTTAKSPKYKLNNGIEMPAPGLGVFHREPEKTVAAVNSAVTNGYRLIDTASVYMAFDRSLRKPGFDFIDMYLIHWPVSSAFEITIESYKAAMMLLSEGRVRAIGVSDFNPGHLDKLIEQTGHTPAVNQIELHLSFNQLELREADKKHGIITQAWSPIGGVNRYGMKGAKEGAPDPEQVNLQTFSTIIHD